jgi:hypothetical protein
MTADRRAIATSIENHDDMAERKAVPPALFGDQAGNQPDLPRQRGQHRLQIGKPCLDFDQEHRAPNGVPGEHIDRTTVAEYVEGVLRNALPAQANELRDHSLDDSRVAAVDQPICESAAPAKLEDGLDLERRAYATEAIDRRRGRARRAPRGRRPSGPRSPRERGRSGACRDASVPQRSASQRDHPSSGRSSQASVHCHLSRLDKPGTTNRDPRVKPA